MSDTSQGPGWWQASDLKWYPPEFYPTDWKKPGDVEQPEPEPVVAPSDTPTPANITDLGEDWAMPAAGAPLPGEKAAEPADPVITPAAPEPGWGTEPPTNVNPVIDPAAPPLQPPQVTEPDPVLAPAPTPQPEPVVEREYEPTPVSEPDPHTAVPEGWAPPSDSPPRAAEPTPSQPEPATWDLEPSAGVGTLADPEPVEAAPTDEPSAEEPGPDIPSGVLAMLGAAGLIVGSFMAWAKAAGTLTTGTVNGLSGSNGWGTLICGLVIAATGVLVMTGNRRPWVGAAMTAAAAIAIGLVVFSIVDIGSTSDELPDVLRAENVSDTVADGAKLDLDVGIWVVAAGGAVSLLAGIMALARRR